MMSPVVQPMTFEELSQIHREEMKGKSLTSCRPDLYRAMADLMNRLRQDYEREVSRDPDSVMSEGANQRRRNAETLVKVIATVRTKKICQRAVNSADGANEELGSMTLEEREYYAQVVELSKKQLGLVIHYRGKKTVSTLIDEPVPVRETTRPMPEPVLEEEPVVAEEEPPVILPPEETEVFDEPVIEESFDDVPEPDIESPQTMEPENEVVQEPEIPKTDTMVLRVLEDLPPFVGPDRDYELHKEDIVTLPTPMAMALINSNKAVAVTPGL